MSHNAYAFCSNGGRYSSDSIGGVGGGRGGVKATATVIPRFLKNCFDGSLCEGKQVIRWWFRKKGEAESRKLGHLCTAPLQIDKYMFTLP